MIYGLWVMDEVFDELWTEMDSGQGFMGIFEGRRIDCNIDSVDSRNGNVSLKSPFHASLIGFLYSWNCQSLLKL
jgi:hypothetical protein